MMRMAHAPVIPDVLQDPIRDKGTAFTQEERDALGLAGRLPSAVLTLDQAARRAYQQMLRQRDDLAKNVYLEQLHDRNEVLYYRVLEDHLAELLPVVYDPVIAQAIEHYSHESAVPWPLPVRRHVGRYRQGVRATSGLGPEDVDLVVCTDAEEILGIGDWGVDGMDISHRQAGDVHRRGGRRPEPGDTGHRWTSARTRGAAERSAVPGESAQPRPAANATTLRQEVHHRRGDACSRTRCCTSRTSARQRPADPRTPPGHRAGSSTTTCREPA